MNPVVRKAFERLLGAAERHDAGVSSRRPALTTSHLAEYGALRSLKDKEAFEAAMRHAQAVGAVKILRPKFQPDGLIERIELVDASKLAELLGRDTQAVKVSQARAALEGSLGAYPVLDEVLRRWAVLKQARQTGPDDHGLWRDACATVSYCRERVEQGATETPVRDASARLFKDSKRIERLAPQIDAVLAGSVDSAARSTDEVLQELGLFREEQPARLAGRVVVRRERGAFVLDRPYSGLPPSTVLGLGSIPSMVLTIENQTTFHAEARARCDTDVLCVYTAGMPSPSWRRMYIALIKDLPAHVPVFHWGDIDEGGFRIAAFLSRAAAEAGKTLEPWNMLPEQAPEAHRRPAADSVVQRMAEFAREAGWENVASEIEAARFVSEQEGWTGPDRDLDILAKEPKS